MIDSVLLKIPVYSSLTSPLLTRKRVKTNGGNISVTTYSENKNNQHKKDGIYKPQVYLEIQNRGREQKYVCIQVSLPKLLFGNSLFEINENSYSAVIDELYFLLQSYHISLPKQSIMEAWVCRIDFAKIVILPKRYTNARDYIEKLLKGGYRPRSDLTQKDVRHGKDGYWLKFYNSTSSVTIYDKYSEIANQGYTTSEKQIIERLQLNRLTRNTIKFEVSLQTTQKVKFTLDKQLHQCHKQYTLTDVFSQSLSQKVLRFYLNASFNNEVDFLCECFTEQEIRTQIRNLYGYKKNKVYLYFILREIEERGAKIVWEEIKIVHSYAYRNSIQKDLKTLKEALTKAHVQKIAPIEFLGQCLDKFELYTPSR